jgi:hypothetical protein
MKYYWTEEVDNVIKQNKKLIGDLFRNWGSQISVSDPITVKY